MKPTPSGDKLLLHKLTDLVNDNLSREDFDVVELAQEAGMSRSSLHRRLKVLKNRNASQFIREIRLQKAMEMLKAGQGTASEVAYKVGFGSPAYFTKCFHEFYGFPPGEAKRRAEIADDSAAGAESQGEENRYADESDKAITRKSKWQRTLLMASLIIVPVIVLVTAWIVSDGLHRGTDDRSIVILPFKNLSSDPDNQYIADGIMEDILSNLSQISDLRVRSRTTSEHFRDTELTSREIAQQVNARNVLEGSMRRDNDRIRVSVQLIDAGRDEHIWSENYDWQITDIIGMQGEIALNIAGKLKAVISDSEAQQVEEIPTLNPEAYDNYLRARFLLHRANSDQRVDINRQGLLASRQYYEKAIAADTNFAEAYAGLANAWFNLSAWGWYKPYMEGIQKAKEYCARALEKDPDCAEAHAVKAVYLSYPERKFAESLSELRTSIQLDPNFPTARQWYAQILMITGPIEEARRQVDRAVELEPYFWLIHNLNSWIYYFEKKYDKGLEACQAARGLNPASDDNIWLFILHYSKLGEAEKAQDELQGLLRLFPETGVLSEKLIQACQKSGVEGIFRWLADVNMNTPLPVEGLSGHPFYISWWFAFLGDREQSLHWLERTMEQKAIPMHYFNLITNNPDFDIIRDDPRFLAVLEKTGLADFNNHLAR